MSGNKKWLGELKKHLRIASRRKPYFNIVISLLNISDGNELISNDIYGLDHQLITNMLGDVVTDRIERRLRVWEVIEIHWRELHIVLVLENVLKNFTRTLEIMMKSKC